MRSFFWAIGLVMLGATMSAAQLLGDPGGQADAKPADRPVPGRPPAAVNRNADAKLPGIRATGAPQANAMFAAMDTDSDGVISKAELRKAIKALKTLDTDDDGSITLAEASVGGPLGPGGAAVVGGPVADDPRIAQLMAMDANNDGSLSANEVPREMQQMIGMADQNGDGAVSRQEIAAAAANMRNQFGGGQPPFGPGGPRGPNGPGLDNAQEAMGRFLQNDKNGDGSLSESELPPQMKRMMQADQNNDGQLDAREMQAAIAQMGDRARALRGGIDPANPRQRGAAERDRKRPNDNN